MQWVCLTHKRGNDIEKERVCTITVPFILTTTTVNEAAESSRFYQIIPPGLSGLGSMQQRWEMATVVWNTAVGVSQPHRAMDMDTRSPVGAGTAGSYHGRIRYGRWRASTTRCYGSGIQRYSNGFTASAARSRTTARVSPAAVDHAASQKLCEPCLVSTPPG